MDEQAGYRERLAELLGEIAAEEGLHPTLIKGVHTFKGSRSVPRAADGLSAEDHHRRPGPEAGLPRRRGLSVRPGQLPGPGGAAARRMRRRDRAGKPILMVNIDVDPTMLGEMLLEMDDASSAPARARRREASPRRR